jgi:tRNA A58 N-methylase Trm61
VANDQPGRNAEQIAYWNGPGGLHWTQRQESNDAILAPISAALIIRAAPAPGDRVIDVGCGCGETTIAMAERVGAAGRVTGVDV